MLSIYQDEMTPKERMQAYFSGQAVDRVPCAPLYGEHASRLIGVTVSQYSHSVEFMAQAQIAAFQKYRSDSIGLGPGLFGIAEAMGAKLTFPEDGMPYISEAFLLSYEDFAKIRPIDPYKDGRIPIYLNALKQMKAAIGKEAVIGTSVGGPFTAAGSLRGTENFLKDLRRNPQKAHELLQVVTESALKFIDAAAELGIKPSISEPTASGTVISKELFIQFAKPYLEQYSKRIIQHFGSGPMLHICGNTTRIWLDMADTGANILSLDNEIDLEEAKAMVGSKVCLAGNVPPVDVLMKGTPEEVLESAKSCLIKASDNPKGFILSSGCALPLNTPPENVVALMNAARVYGRFGGK